MPYRAPNLSAPPPPRGRSGAVAAAVIGVVALAAGGVVVARRGAAPPASAPVPVTALVRLPWPGHAHAWTVRRGDGAERDVVFGPLRLTVRAGDVAEAAPVRFAAGIVAAVPVATGWVFVTADGAVAASETFLGAPRAIGRFPCAFKVTRDTVGRAVVLGEDGSLWTTDGTAPLARTRPPGEARAATFMDGRHGAAVLRDGPVVLTADAGQTWDRYVLPGDVAWDVAPEQGGVAIETTRGRELFRWEGAGVPGRPGTSRPLRTQEPRESENRLRSFINRQYEMFQPSGDVARCGSATVSAEPPPPDAPRRYVCVGDRPLQPLTLLPLPYQRGVAATDLLSGTESGPVRGRFWRAHPDVDGETLVRVRWMGVDEAGEFRGLTSATGRGLGVHWPLEQRGPLRVEGVSRRGVLVSTHDRAAEPVLAWGTAERPFARVRDPFVERVLAGTRSFAAPGADGGVVVVFAAPLYDAARETWSTTYAERGPQVGVALAIDPGGAVTARRSFLGDDPNLMMIARVGDAVGPVVRDRSEPPRWRLLPVGSDLAEPLPSLRWEGIAACAAAGPATTTLSVAYPPIALERAGADQEPTVVSRADLALVDGALCVRALSLGGRRLAAAPGDRFVGALRCGPASP